MSRRFMAAAHQYHKRQQQHQRHSLEDPSESSDALLLPSKQLSPPSTPGGGEGPASAFARFAPSAGKGRRNSTGASGSAMPSESSKNLRKAKHQHHQQRFSASDDDDDEEEELSPEKGALQFLPALNNDDKKKGNNRSIVPGSPFDYQNQNAVPGTSWDDDEDDDDPFREALASSIPVEEKKEADPADMKTLKVSPPSSTMAFRARQYKQQRRAAAERNGEKANSVVSGANSLTNRSVASSILHSAAHALRKAPADSTAASAKAHLNNSNNTSASKAPFHSSNTSVSTRSRSPISQRPKSPPAARGSKNFLSSRASASGASAVAFSQTSGTSPTKSLPVSKKAEGDAQKSEPYDSGDADSAVEPTPPSSVAGSRVSRLASMFGGRASPVRGGGARASPLRGGGKRASPLRGGARTSPLRARASPLRGARASPLRGGRASPQSQQPQSNTSPYRRLRPAAARKSLPATSSTPVVTPASKRVSLDETSLSAAKATPVVTPAPKRASLDDSLSATKATPATVEVTPPNSVTPAPKQASTTSPRGSPVPSSTSGGSSSCYVGWPGTQDRRGKTVVAPQSSNEEESHGGGGNGSVVSYHAGSVASWTTSPVTPLVDANKYREFSSSRSAVGPSTSGISSSLLRRHALHRASPPGAAITVPSLSTPTAPRQTHRVTPASVDDDDEDTRSDYVTQAIGRRSLGGGSVAQMDDADFDKAPPSRRRLFQNGGNHHHQPASSATPNNIRAAPLPSRAFVLGGGAQSWGISKDDDNNDPPSSPSTAFSKTSSAYFNERDMNPLAYPDLQQKSQRASPVSFNPYGRPSAATADSSVLRSKQQHQAPTRESLAANDHRTPPHRTFSGGKGFRGLLDKTQEFPALIDDLNNDSDASSRTSRSSRQDESVASGRGSRGGPESDVFDGLSLPESQTPPNYVTASALQPPSRPSKQSKSHKSPKDLAKPHQFVRSNSAIKKALYPEPIAEEAEEFHRHGASPSRGSRDESFASRRKSPHRNGSRGAGKGKEDDGDFKLVLLGGGLTAIQSSSRGFASRRSQSEDCDESKSTSEVPSVEEMMDAGTNANDASLVMHGETGSVRSNYSFASQEDDILGVEYDEDEEPLQVQSVGDLSGIPHAASALAQYGVDPDVMKKLLRLYRQMSDRVATSNLSLADLERLEDERKAFALFEMRSRIMEKDMERGLERRGGTAVVDDLITTSYYSTAYRIRDAVIVAKAWRDGASPKDVTNTQVLTRREERTYFIKRPLALKQQQHFSSSSSVVSGFSTMSQSRYFWEAVKWIDDTDFMLYRCPSLGPRMMRGFEMFTIGDCQSILLKLTKERCVELRTELNAATRKQLVAEQRMKEEESNGADSHGEEDDFMTESEMDYLAAMEKVKTVSKKLVVAEQAFSLVRDRVEKLIAKYEELLVQIEHADEESDFDAEDSAAASSSVLTYCDETSSIYSEDETEMWARRARRAELKAEVAAREALMARQEANQIREESQLELERVQQKLAELQSEASTNISQQQKVSVLFQNLAPSKGTTRSNKQEAVAPLPPPSSDQIKIDGVKQRFRDRTAAKKNPQPPPLVPKRPSPINKTRKQSSLPKQLVRAAGEEMFSHLDFYERSLKAVQ